MHKSYIIRTIVITLAGWLVAACSLLPVADKPPVTPVETQAETQAECNCQTPEFATEAEIKEIQARLILLGYPVGDIDGVVGNITRDAIKAYQADHQLLTDGRPSTELLAHIKATAGNGQVPAVN